MEIKLLLDHGAAPSQPIESSGDALTHTTSEEIKTLLLKAGADWPMWYKIQNGMVDGKSLENTVLFPAIQGEWLGITDLHRSIATGNKEEFEKNIQDTSSINEIDCLHQSTPLGYSAKFDRLEFAKQLVELGADKNKAGAEWATPLAWAKQKSNSEIIELLC